MLHFVYRDTLIEDEDLVASSSSFVCSTSDTLAGKLLVAADKYGLERLKLMCESYLCKEISVDSVAGTLALANSYHAMELKAVCLKFAAENLAGMFLSSAFIVVEICYFYEKIYHSKSVEPSNGWCLSWFRNFGFGIPASPDFLKILKKLRKLKIFVVRNLWFSSFLAVTGTLEYNTMVEE